MTTYTVHHPARTAPEILTHSEQAEFVKDGFCWPALLLPFVWLLYRRMWLAFLAYLAFVVTVSLVGEALSLAEYVITLLGTSANVVLAFEANNLRRWTLRRRRYLDVGVVIAKPLIEAERRFFQALIERRESPGDTQPAPADKGRQPVRVAGALEEPADMVGLFPSPGARA